MKILLTKEEYEKRVVDNLVKIGKESFNLETINEYVAYQSLYKLAEETYTNHIMYKDTCNQMYLSVFFLDRNGNHLRDTMYDITEEECRQFNSQGWFKKFEKEQKEHWRPYCKMRPFDKDKHPYDVMEVVEQYFQGRESHFAYSATEEAFEILFGHKYDTDNIKPIVTKELVTSNW